MGTCYYEKSHKTPTEYSSGLVGFKERLMEQVDDHCCDDVIGGCGFEWPDESGNMLSASCKAQQKWTSMYVYRANLSYPFYIRTKDDKTRLTVSNQADVESLYGANINYMFTCVALAEAAKHNIWTAETEAAAQAAYDDYMEG